MTTPQEFSAAFHLFNHLLAAVRAERQRAAVIEKYAPKEGPSTPIPEDFEKKTQEWGNQLFLGDLAIAQGEEMPWLAEVQTVIGQTTQSMKHSAEKLSNTLSTAAGDMSQENISLLAASFLASGVQERSLSQGVLELGKATKNEGLIQEAEQRLEYATQKHQDGLRFVSALENKDSWGKASQWYLSLRTQPIPGLLRLQRLDLFFLLQNLAEDAGKRALSEYEPGGGSNEELVAKAIGLKLEDFQEWKAANVEHPAEINEWHARGVASEDAAKAKQLGLLAEETAGYIGVGLRDLLPARVLKERLGNFEEVLQWMKHGIEASDIVAWLEAGVEKPEEAAKKKEEGFTPPPVNFEVKKKGQGS